MERKNRIITYLGILFLTGVFFLFVAPDIAEARRGSFGGSKRSTRSFKSKRSTKKRNTRQPSARSKVNQTPMKSTSFGGTRISKNQARARYGTPRKTTTTTGKNASGKSQQYVMNGYGGYGSSLMTGYVMGATPFLWSMPFHPAFYYSRPSYVQNADGTIGVYPPTFSWGKLIFTLIVIFGVILIIRAIIKARKRSSGNVSKSSFG